MARAERASQGAADEHGRRVGHPENQERTYVLRLLRLAEDVMPPGVPEAEQLALPTYQAGSSDLMLAICVNKIKPSPLLRSLSCESLPG